MSFHSNESEITPNTMDEEPDETAGYEFAADNDFNAHERDRHHESPWLVIPDGVVVAENAEGSIYEGSRSTLGQEQYGMISKSGEERIMQVLLQKHEAIVKRNEGLEKLGAYLLQNDENTIPRTESQSISRMTQDENEEFSLHLSRGTGTGSQQLELWITEVNLAVSRSKQPRLRINTDEMSLNKQQPPTETPMSRMAPSAPPERNDVSTPPPRQTLSTMKANLQDNNNVPSVTKDSWQDAKEPAEKANRVEKQSPSNSKAKLQSSSPVQKPKCKDGSSAGSKANWQSNSPAGSNANAAKRQDKTSVSSNDKWREILPNNNESIDKHSSFATPRVKNNSKQIMESIEGKYKSLRDDLIRENTFEETHCSEEEEVRPQRRTRERYESQSNTQLHNSVVNLQSTNAVHSMVSAVISSKDALRLGEYSVRDHFSLGMLSTRSSGILSTTNSWSTASSFESERSERSGNSFSGKGGCGIFLCE